MVFDAEVLQEATVEVDADSFGGADLDLGDVGPVDFERGCEVGHFDAGAFADYAEGESVDRYRARR